MKYFYTIFLLIACNILIAQKNVSIDATLYNAESKEFVPFATISFKNSLVTSTTNVNGNFKLTFSDANLPDTLMIRHLSFETEKLYLTKNNYKNYDYFQIFPKLNTLETIDIHALTAQQIIEKSIQNISLNYNEDVYFLDGFYRQKHQENNKFVRLIECYAQVKVDSRNRLTESQKESFYISKIRRSLVYERNGDEHGDHLVDLFSENPIVYAFQSFLNEKSLMNYEYTLLPSHNNFHFKIHFENKAWNSNENKSGFIVIDKNDFAIIEMKIISTNNHSSSVINKSNWKFQNGIFHIHFIKHGKKYAIGKISKYYNHYVENENTGSVSFIVEEYFEWFTRKVLYDSHKKFSLLSNLYSMEYEYESSFWDNAILPNLNDKTFKDLNSFKNIEKQFREN